MKLLFSLCKWIFDKLPKKKQPDIKIIAVNSTVITIMHKD